MPVTSLNFGHIRDAESSTSRSAEPPMGIELVMRRLSPEDGAKALVEGCLGPDYVEEFEEISKGWGVVTHVLADGVREGELPLAAQAIGGGACLVNEPTDFGGTRVIPAAQIPAIHEALIQIDDVEIERRYERLDFTGTYGGRENGRSSRTLEAVAGWICDLRDFYARAVVDGSAVAIWYD